MKIKIVAVVLCMLLSVPGFATNVGFEVKYVGGTVPDLVCFAGSANTKHLQRICYEQLGGCNILLCRVWPTQRG